MTRKDVEQQALALHAQLCEWLRRERGGPENVQQVIWVVVAVVLAALIVGVIWTFVNGQLDKIEFKTP